MKIETFKSSDRLKSIITSFTVIETTSIMETTVLPHLGLVFAIQVSGKVFLKKRNETTLIAPLTVSGQRNTFRTFVYSPNTVTILVSFTETGAHSVFGETVFKLYENAESLENLIGTIKVKELLSKLLSTNLTQERIQIIENFLATQLNEKEPDMLILASIKKIHNEKGLCKIGELSSGFGLSMDAFEKRFRKIVGSSPKQFSTVVRLKEVIKQQNNHKLLTDLVYSFEYYDQSHFIKQFKEFTGQTPKHFFKEPYIW
jgi:AraC-like DNA-binding protein